MLRLVPDRTRGAGRLTRHFQARLASPGVGQTEGMRNLFLRSTIVATPVIAMALLGAGTSSAEPLNCVNGQFWDPITNTCQTPRPADDCAPGQYWNALSNVCRPLGQI